LIQKIYKDIKRMQLVYRILDANLDRAREGLRIIEEWCRFGLNNTDLTEECKRLRQELAALHTVELRAARDTPGDPGTELTHPQEEQRTTIPQVIQANLCRVQEALRVLEEYSKLDKPDNMALACKQMRYRVYTLESNLQLQQRRQQLSQARLYLVTSPHENLFAVVEAALKGGVDIVQYRDKTAEDGIRLKNAQALCELCHYHDALFIVNDRPDIAVLVGADGVHVGQQDLPVAKARQILGAQAIIGCSTTNPTEMRMALQEGADYIGVGPVYETPTKAGKAAAGPEYIRYAAQHAPIPWFAIGGIDAQNLQDVLAAGANRVAIVRALMQAEQPTLVAQDLYTQLHHQVE
jgi:thiamine-phosphate pyrophosphorylase